MGRTRSSVMLLGAAGATAAAMAVMRHNRRAATGRAVPGGVLMGDAVAYDTHSRLLLGPFYRGVAADIGAVAPHGARVLEVGCGPGQLSIRLAREYGLDMTGLDLDPAMIERARANVERTGNGEPHPPSFVIGNVGSLPFADRSFDLVVSTLSMHHWADPTAGLTEIGRVLRPGGRAVIWEFRPGVVPLHKHVPDPVEHAGGSDLRVVDVTPWRWPWRFTLTQRIELIRTEGAPGGVGI